MLSVLLAACLGGCAAVRPDATRVPPPSAPPDPRVPDFARVPYEPFSRASAVAIALREWRLFGAPVDDDPPGSRPPPAPDQKPERAPGLWQRVGEYWWLGVDPGTPDGAWTGRHDATGRAFDPMQDGYYAWSAAFIGYVMRIAGAGNRFPYAANHATYINVARAMADGRSTGWVVAAERPELYAPRLGDLLCTGRGRARALRFDDLPAARFPSHCDIVAGVAPGSLSVIGGNVDDAVTMKHVPVTADGRLAAPDGTLLDTRYPWFVVLRILYDQE